MPASAPTAIWGPRKAWLCAAGFLLMQFVVIGLVWLIWFPYPKIAYWVRMPLGIVILGVTRHSLAFMLLLVLTQTWTVSRFVKDFELQRPSRFDVLIYGLVGAGIALSLVMVADRYFAQTLSIQTSLTVGHNASGSERICLSLLILYAAFIEEVLLRGFIYKAFRSSWGIPMSIMCIVLITSVGHWTSVTKSVEAFILHSLFSILLCVIREKTKNLWYCIICHISYNLALSMYGEWIR